jgi:hypothetical protein
MFSMVEIVKLTIFKPREQLCSQETTKIFADMTQAFRRLRTKTLMEEAGRQRDSCLAMAYGTRPQTSSSAQMSMELRVVQPWLGAKNS